MLLHDSFYDGQETNTKGSSRYISELHTAAPSMREDAACQKGAASWPGTSNVRGRRIGYRRKCATVSGMHKRESTMVSTGKGITSEREPIRLYCSISR
ncbi:hypothetical protein Hypma_002072 [Hypsizygus marmoreus]|uniref:Uncharacterized protein n=1 Tax=Hypsizygus marmoreus TaxID=39966 RepID=A0A369K3I1_HYPMA|nr:hypothetical protein Hypma_002072 [Hypsizygus marmoreus]